MRLLGHPIHVMLLHFPIALWPAHFALHVFAMQLPAGISSVAGFWLLVGGTVLGWLAAAFGALDLLEIARESDSPAFRAGLVHAVVNSSVLAGFTVVAAIEYSHYPTLHHGPGFLLLEAALLVAMFAGNYFGGAIVWGGFSLRENLSGRAGSRSGRSRS